MENLMSLTIILLAIIFFAFIFIYLMYVRMKQLETELHDLKSRISITDEELTRLSKDIEDFKKINI
jgi:cell division protein FtsL